MKLRNLYFQVYCVIFCECVLQRQMHIEKRTESWCTACLVFPDGKICILDLHTQHLDQETACQQKPPCSLPITTALLCPPAQALACSFSYYMGLASSIQHCCLRALVDRSFPLLQSIHWVKIPQFIYPFYCSWPFGYLVLCGCHIQCCHGQSIIHLLVNIWSHSMPCF